MQNIELEIKVIKKFVEKTKQDRYIQFVSEPKNRHKFVKKLAHFDSFVWNLFKEVSGNKENMVILSFLQENNIFSKSCYAISENSELDTRILETEMAIQKIIGYGMGTILVFGNGEVIFYEGESPKNRYIGKSRN
jgi:hypothetical protein